MIESKVTISCPATLEHPGVSIEIHENANALQLIDGVVAFMLARGYCESTIRAALKLDPEEELWSQE